MYVYDETTGRPCEYPPYSGRLIARPPDTRPPCRIAGLGCPKGTPEDQKGLSAMNHAAWRHDRECRATGQFPNDPIVRRNAALISAVEASHSRRAWSNFHAAVLTALTKR